MGNLKMNFKALRTSALEDETHFSVPISINKSAIVEKTQRNCFHFSRFHKTI